MKTIAVCAGLILWSLLLYGQKSPLKFGEITMPDMTMTVYPKDSSASSVVLLNYGKAYIDRRGSPDDPQYYLVFERHTRIKVLTKDGLSAADVSIPLRKVGTTEEKVTNLKATTYNLEGGKIVEQDLSKDGIFKEKFNRYFYLQKFTMPGVKEGSIIEYSYNVLSEFWTQFPNWQFQ